MDTTNMTVEQLQAALTRMNSENQALKAKEAKRSTISCKVSEKGCLSVYGLGRYPTTLYRQQWERLLTPSTIETINAFIAANAGQLKVKEA
jgi:hypothetical protein